MPVRFGFGQRDLFQLGGRHETAFACVYISAAAEYLEVITDRVVRWPVHRGRMAACRRFASLGNKSPRPLMTASLSGMLKLAAATCGRLVRRGNDVFVVCFFSRPSPRSEALPELLLLSLLFVN